MVNITVGGIAPVQNKQHNKDNRQRSNTKHLAKERRKKKKDHCRHVGAGVVVTLSYKSQRRQNSEHHSNSI